MRVEWHPVARADLAELVAYIATDNPAAAYRLHGDIREQIDTLAATRKSVGQVVSVALAS